MADHCRTEHINGTPVRVTGNGPLTDTDQRHLADIVRAVQRREMRGVPLHRTESTTPWGSCSTCDGGGCHDCTEPSD